MLFRGLHDKWWYNEEKRGKAVVRTKVSDRDNYEVGQFSGLVDSNKNNIYSGDIIQSDLPLITEVIFHDGEFMCNDYSPLYAHAYFEDFDNPVTCVVVGNIYQNPELLEGGSNA